MSYVEYYFEIVTVGQFFTKICTFVKLFCNIYIDRPHS